MDLLGKNYDTSVRCILEASNTNQKNETFKLLDKKHMVIYNW